MALSFIFPHPPEDNKKKQNPKNYPPGVVYTGRPGGVSGYPRSWYQVKFREFESSRVHTRIIFVGTFSCARSDLRKAREREFATVDEKSTSSGIAGTYARIKIEGKNRGGEGTTPVTTACPEAGK